MKLGSGGTKKIYGHFLDSYAVYTDMNARSHKPIDVPPLRWRAYAQIPRLYRQP